MPRYSVGKVNTAELEAAVHVAPAARSGGSGSNERRLSNACITGVRRSRDGGTLGALRLEGVACFSLLN